MHADRLRRAGRRVRRHLRFAVRHAERGTLLITRATFRCAEDADVEQQVLVIAGEGQGLLLPLHGLRVGVPLLACQAAAATRATATFLITSCRRTGTSSAAGSTPARAGFTGRRLRSPLGNRR